eukprot:gene11222-biopygen6816
MRCPIAAQPRCPAGGSPLCPASPRPTHHPLSDGLRLPLPLPAGPLAPARLFRCEMSPVRAPAAAAARRRAGAQERALGARLSAFPDESGPSMLTFCVAGGLTSRLPDPGPRSGCQWGAAGTVFHGGSGIAAAGLGRAGTLSRGGPAGRVTEAHRRLPQRPVPYTSSFTAREAVARGRRCPAERGVGRLSAESVYPARRPRSVPRIGKGASMGSINGEHQWGASMGSINGEHQWGM